MGLETATYIHELDPTNPVGATDPKSQGDDHIRLTKSTLQNTLPNVEGPVTASHTELNILDGATLSTAELNFVDGVTSSIQTQLDSKPTYSGVLNNNTYTPTLTAISNITTLVSAVCQWMRVGDVITVSGLVTVTPTAAGFASYAISLPVASNFAGSNQCGGAGYHGGVAVGIFADSANDRATAQFVPLNNAVQGQPFTFTYRVV